MLHKHERGAFVSARSVGRHNQEGQRGLPLSIVCHAAVLHAFVRTTRMNSYVLLQQLGVDYTRLEPKRACQ